MTLLALVTLMPLEVPLEVPVFLTVAQLIFVRALVTLITHS